jgi:hypothetical protein
MFAGGNDFGIDNPPAISFSAMALKAKLAPVSRSPDFLRRIIDQR